MKQYRKSETYTAPDLLGVIRGMIFLPHSWYALLIILLYLLFSVILKSYRKWLDRVLEKQDAKKALKQSN